MPPGPSRQGVGGLGISGRRNPVFLADVGCVFFGFRGSGFLFFCESYGGGSGFRILGCAGAF